VVISNRLHRERAVRGRQVISSCAKVPARYWSKCALTHLDETERERLRHTLFHQGHKTLFTLNLTKSNLCSIWINSPQSTTGVSQTVWKTIRGFPSPNSPNESAVLH